MSTIERDQHENGGDAPTETGFSEDVDPRDTDHPAGSEQAAENAAEESPS